jgi:hypothetical protein
MQRKLASMVAEIEPENCRVSRAAPLFAIK